MRVVVDTNVIVSGIFWTGIPGQILDAWGAGRFSLCASTDIFEEYYEVIDRLADKCGRGDLASPWKVYLFESTELIATTERYEGCRDPDDAKFVECALSAGASYIVSGDGDLLALKKVEGITIATPALFMQHLRQNYSREE